MRRDNFCHMDMPFKHVLLLLMVWGFMFMISPSAPAGDIPPEEKLDSALSALFTRETAAAREAVNISPKIQSPEDPMTFLVYLADTPDLSAERAIKDPALRRQAVWNNLKRSAKISQAPLVSLLEELRNAGLVSTWQSFHVSNCVAVTGVREAALRIAALDGVRRLTPNYEVQLVEPVRKDPSSEDPASEKEDPIGRLSAFNWNVDIVDAERVWDEYGIRGEGMVIATISSGVQWNHPALIGAYRGWNGNAASHDYNWFDFDGEAYGSDYGPSKTTTPYDAGDLGTFALGCAVGDGGEMNTQIGVAPGARWICVTPNGMKTGGSRADDVMIHKAFQWLLAPTNLTGAASSARPDLAPDIVLCAFSTLNPIDETFRANIQALNNAGIFVTAPVGDVGSAAGGAASPGSLPEVFAAGAVDRWGTLYEMSGRGPSVYGAIKPDICAPGLGVYGSIPGSEYENGYTGTAIAAAHVAGVYALLKSARPSVEIGVIQEVMRSTATDLGTKGADNTYGYGYINAYRALGVLTAAGRLEGTVTSTMGGVPIGGVDVRVTSLTAPFDTLTTQTRSDGRFYFPLREGFYDVEYTSVFHKPRTLAGITVKDGSVSLASISLEPKPTFRFSGRILNARTQTPILATIYVVGTTLQHTTDATGTYSFNLPAGTFQIKVDGRSYRSAHPTVNITADTALDFLLEGPYKILVVDAEYRYGWDRGWKVIDYYKKALEEADYPYDAWAYGGLPTLQQLLTYDLVFWAQADRGPASVDAVALLKGYLDAGKSLLLCGHNIAFADGGTDFFRNYLRADLIHGDAGAGEATGANILSGTKLTFGGAGTSIRPANAPFPFSPDVIISNDKSAIPCLYYPGGQTAGLAINPCGAPAYRVVYLAAGFESVQRDASMSSLLDKAIKWLVEAKQTYSVSAFPGESLGPGEVGRTYVHYQTITNTGALADTFDLTLSASSWPASIWDEGLTTNLTNTGSLAACASRVIAVRVDVPNDVLPQASDNVILTVKSRGSVKARQDVSLVTKAFLNWKTESGMLTRRYRQVSASAGDCFVYVIGGLDWLTGEALSMNEQYDTMTGLWEHKEPKPVAAANSGVAVIDGKIYVVGGFNLSLVPPRLSSVDVYDPATDTWTLKTSLPYFASGVACASWNGYLYTFGGFNGTEETDDAYRYDPRTDRWEQLSPMPGGGRSQAMAATAGGRIYVLGGWPNLRRVESLNPLTGNWTTEPSMGQGRHSFGCETVSEIAVDYIYVFGGGASWTGIAQGERFNTSARKWEAIYSLSDVRRAGMSSAFSGGKLYAFGGVWDRPAEAVEVLPVKATLSASRILASKETASEGDTIVYTMEISNGGFLPMDGVGIVTALSPELILDEDSLTAGLRWNADTRQITWNGNMAANETRRLSFQADIGTVPYTSYVVENTMDISGDLCGVFRRFARTRIVGPDITESYKIVDKARANHNQDLSYTIRIVNKSEDDDALGVVMHDPLPALTTLVAGSLTGGATYNASENRIEWTGDLLRASPGVFTPEYDDSRDPGSGVVYEWLDAPTKLPIEGDDEGIVVNIGFPFQWFGTEYNTVGISTNGYLTFGTDWSLPDNHCLPSTVPPQGGVIAPFWDDLIIGTVVGDGIHVGNFGESPNRVFVVQWKAHDFQDIGNLLPAYEFQVLLHETDGEVTCQYKNMAGGYNGTGSSASVGVEDSFGDKGASYLCDGEPAVNLIEDGLAVRFRHVQYPFLDERVFTFKAHVADQATLCNENIRNVAAVNYGAYQLNLAAETRINTTPIDESSFYSDRATCLPGDKIAYTLNVRNSGNFFAYVTVACAIPADTTFVRIIEGPATWDENTKTVKMTDYVGINVTQPVRFEVQANTGLANGTVLDCVADVTAECAPAPFNASARTVVSSYLLDESSMGATPSSVSPGENLDYIIRIENTGLAPVACQLQSTIPQDLTVTVGSVAATGGQVSFNYTFGTLGWGGTVPAKSAVFIVFKAQVKPTLIPGHIITVQALINHPAGQITRQADTPVIQSGKPRSTGWTLY